MQGDGVRGGKGIECEVCADRIHLEHASKFKYLARFLDESDTYEAECNRKAVSGRRVAVLLGL